MRVLAADDAGAAVAASALQAGEVVAIPTDTVYGLAARVDCLEAVRTLFELKGRPDDVAIAVLAASGAQARELAGEWSASAERLAAAWWPGALTMVVPARVLLASLGGSGATVGVRVPGSAWVRDLCSQTGPLAVTSANGHGEAPMTSAGAIAEAWPNGSPRFSIVLDGGPCEGMPSTVVDCSQDPPQCLREGALTWARIVSSLEHGL